jgi:hypothetical protein
MRALRSLSQVSQTQVGHQTKIHSRTHRELELGLRKPTQRQRLALETYFGLPWDVLAQRLSLDQVKADLCRPALHFAGKR